MPRSKKTGKGILTSDNYDYLTAQEKRYQRRLGLVSDSYTVVDGEPTIQSANPQRISETVPATIQRGIKRIPIENQIVLKDFEIPVAPPGSRAFPRQPAYPMGRTMAEVSKQIHAKTELVQAKDAFGNPMKDSSGKPIYYSITESPQKAPVAIDVPQFYQSRPAFMIQPSMGKASKLSGKRQSQTYRDIISKPPEQARIEIQRPMQEGRHPDISLAQFLSTVKQTPRGELSEATPSEIARFQQQREQPKEEQSIEQKVQSILKKRESSEESAIIAELKNQLKSLRPVERVQKAQEIKDTIRERVDLAPDDELETMDSLIDVVEGELSRVKFKTPPPPPPPRPPSGSFESELLEAVKGKKLKTPSTSSSTPLAFESELLEAVKGKKLKTPTQKPTPAPKPELGDMFSELQKKAKERKEKLGIVEEEAQVFTQEDIERMKQASEEAKQARIEAEIARSKAQIGEHRKAKEREARALKLLMECISDTYNEIINTIDVTGKTEEGASKELFSVGYKKLKRPFATKKDINEEWKQVSKANRTTLYVDNLIKGWLSEHCKEILADRPPTPPPPPPPPPPPSQSKKSKKSKPLMQEDIEFLEVE